tara:strand:+ start:671 stop:2116 length:1446 start_codon:yes stop_codon:yes gene_type:complete
MTNPRILFWHRKDLRTNDNKALNKALSISKAITSIYIFDKDYPNDYNSSSRAWFLGESLYELSSIWQKADSRLIIQEGSPLIQIPKIAKIINAKYVFCNRCIEPYEIERDSKIKIDLEKSNIQFVDFLDHLLLDPAQVFTGTNKPYSVYGPFYKNLKGKLEQIKYNFASTEELKLTQLNDLKKELIEHQYIKNSEKNLIDFLEKNNFSGSEICPCKPGQNAAEKLLDDFSNSSKITSYQNNRDFPSKNGTSYLSASLRFGTISIRKIWEKTLNLQHRDQDPKKILSIETWQKELVWREFYQHCLYNFPELEQGPYRKKWVKFPWQNNQEWFSRWAEGNTGIAIVDAAMRQLNTSGWMHNRCRMIVASFLVKDLLCNWQMGEKRFMKILVDGDLAANNGGWQWSASSGMDPKPLRIFNPHTQTQKFDPLCQYIKHWVPELSKINNSEIINGTFSKFEKNHYPNPIVDHNIQQRIFKSFYAEI